MRTGYEDAVQKEETVTEIDHERITVAKPTDRHVHEIKKQRKKLRKRYFDAGLFWKVFVMIVGFIILLGFIAPFFFFNSLGWWVILISLGFIVVGITVMLLGTLIDKPRHDLTPLIPIALGVCAFFAWILGIIILALYNKFG